MPHCAPNLWRSLQLQGKAFSLGEGFRELNPLFLSSLLKKGVVPSLHLSKHEKEAAQEKTI